MIHNYLPVQSFICRAIYRNKYIKIPKTIHTPMVGDRVIFISNPKLILQTQGKNYHDFNFFNKTEETNLKTEEEQEINQYSTLSVTCRQYFLNYNNTSVTTIHTILCDWIASSNPHYNIPDKMERIFYETFILRAKPNEEKYRCDYTYRWSQLPSYVKEPTPKYLDIQESSVSQTDIKFVLLDKEKLIFPKVNLSSFKPYY
jgi:hypothetical protein